MSPPMEEKNRQRSFIIPSNKNFKKEDVELEDDKHLIYKRNQTFYYLAMKIKSIEYKVGDFVVCYGKTANESYIAKIDSIFVIKKINEKENEVQVRFNFFYKQNEFKEGELNERKKHEREIYSSEEFMDQSINIIRNKCTVIPWGAVSSVLKINNKFFSKENEGNFCYYYKYCNGIFLPDMNAMKPNWMDLVQVTNNIENNNNNNDNDNNNEPIVEKRDWVELGETKDKTLLRTPWLKREREITDQMEDKDVVQAGKYMKIKFQEEKSERKVFVSRSSHLITREEFAMLRTEQNVRFDRMQEQLADISQYLLNDRLKKK